MPRSAASLTASEFNLSLTLQAPAATAWRALTRDIGLWWPATFHTSEQTKKFILEPKLGGMMGEVGTGGDGLVWYRVIGVERGRSLLLSGHLLPPWGGPATSLVRVTLTPLSARTTKFDFSDHLFGVVGDGATESGWTSLFAEHFQPHVERRRSSAK